MKMKMTRKRYDEIEALMEEWGRIEEKTAEEEERRPRSLISLMTGSFDDIEALCKEVEVTHEEVEEFARIHLS